MGRALLSYRVSDQVGDRQPNVAVQVLEMDGVTPLLQVLYANPTGPATRTNPLTTDTYGLAVAYAETPQRAVVSVGGVQTVVDITDDPGDIAALTSTVIAGDVLIGSGAGSVGRLGIGAAFQELAANATATAPEWFNGVRAVLTAIGDIPYASAPNTIARAPKGAAWQSLVMNAGANAPQWSSCVLALAAAAGDTFYATGANVLAKLTKGTAFQVLAMNAGATAPAWANCAVTVVTTAGDIIYATGANALARLAAGATGTVLHGGTTPFWGSVVTADIAAGAVTTRIASAAGSTSPTTTNTAVAALADPTLSINCPVTSDVYVWVNGEYNDSAGGAIVDYHVRIAGGAWTLVAQTSQPSAAGRYFLSGHHVFVGVTPGAKTIEVGNGSSTGASTITHYAAGRRMTAIGVAR